MDTKQNILLRTFLNGFIQDTINVMVWNFKNKISVETAQGVFSWHKNQVFILASKDTNPAAQESRELVLRREGANEGIDFNGIEDSF